METTTNHHGIIAVMVELPADPALVDAQAYSDHLSALRTILDTDGLFTGVS